MNRWIKSAILVISTIIILSQETKAQTDTTKTLTQQSTITKAPEIIPEPENKRQRNKTEVKVFVSCLLIVLTTILIYNVRSK
jgi:hypothetical protein